MHAQNLRALCKKKEQVEIVAVDIAVARKAQEIRNQLLLTGLRLETPDIIHAATAVVSGVKMLHTFDHDLLRLNGRPEIDGIAVTKCYIPGPLSLFPSATANKPR